MANPIILAAALARTRKLTCPYCGLDKVADRKPKAFRVCARCHKHFPDPLTKPRRRK